MKKIKTGDKVQVITGNDKGKITEVEGVDGDKVYLKGVRLVKKAVKGKGFVEKQLSVAVSNVMVYCDKCKKPVRVSIKIDDKKGTKSRICKKCEKEIK